MLIDFLDSAHPTVEVSPKVDVHHGYWSLELGDFEKQTNQFSVSIMQIFPVLSRIWVRREAVSSPVLILALHCCCTCCPSQTDLLDTLKY